MRFFARCLPNFGTVNAKHPGSSAIEALDLIHDAGDSDAVMSQAGGLSALPLQQVQEAGVDCQQPRHGGFEHLTTTRRTPEVLCRLPENHH